MSPPLDPAPLPRADVHVVVKQSADQSSHPCCFAFSFLSKFTPASLNPIQPPLVVSWHTNEVASGAIEPVKELLQRMRAKQWKEQEALKSPPTPIQDFTRRVRAWWNEHE